MNVREALQNGVAVVIRKKDKEGRFYEVNGLWVDTITITNFNRDGVEAQALVVIDGRPGVTSLYSVKLLGNAQPVSSQTNRAPASQPQGYDKSEAPHRPGPSHISQSVNDDIPF